MKKSLLIAGLVGVFFSANAQEQEQVEEKSEVKKEVNVTYVTPKATIEKFHNQAELEKMGKLELTKLYIERVKVLTEILPYIALNNHPAGANLEELGIPETKPNVDDLENEVKNTNSYIEGIDHTLTDVIPYADKGNIIWSILFMEDTINSIDKAPQDR